MIFLFLQTFTKSIWPRQSNPRYSTYKFNLHSVTIEVNIVTSSANIEIISAGWPAEQPTTTS